uniref:7TM_GPCR_Srx domain-containing protein n=1 Tax=Bursaphelenchus xylophilus TaxID=6326 RepID=A0A1I7SNF9_BURXY
MQNGTFFATGQVRHIVFVTYRAHLLPKLSSIPGVIAIFANLLNVLFYLYQPDIRKSHAYIIAVDFGEMINGLSYILTGIGRGAALIQGRYLQPISVNDCFFTTYWPAFLIIGPETTALLTILVSFERIVAVNLPHKYDTLFHEERKYLWFIVVAMVQMGFLTMAAFSAYRDQTLFSDRHCAIISSTSDFFSTFHFAFLVLSYVVSFVSLFIVYNFQNVSPFKPIKRRSK